MAKFLTPEDISDVVRESQLNALVERVSQLEGKVFPKEKKPNRKAKVKKAKKEK